MLHFNQEMWKAQMLVFARPSQLETKYQGFQLGFVSNKLETKPWNSHDQSPTFCCTVRVSREIYTPHLPLLSDKGLASLCAKRAANVFEESGMLCEDMLNTQDACFMRWGGVRSWKVMDLVWRAVEAEAGSRWKGNQEVWKARMLVFARLS